MQENTKLRSKLKKTKNTTQHKKTKATKRKIKPTNNTKQCTTQHNAKHKTYEKTYKSNAMLHPKHNKAKIKKNKKTSLYKTTNTKKS